MKTVYRYLVTKNKELVCAKDSRRVGSWIPRILGRLKKKNMSRVPNIEWRLLTSTAYKINNEKTCKHPSEIASWYKRRGNKKRKIKRNQWKKGRNEISTELFLFVIKPGAWNQVVVLFTHPFIYILADLFILSFSITMDTVHRLY